MSKLVTVASGLHLEEACLARAELEGSGIYCFLANEMIMQIHCPQLSFGAGGVELRVMEQDEQAALEVLAGKEIDGGSGRTDCPQGILAARNAHPRMWQKNVPAGTAACCSEFC